MSVKPTTRLGYHFGVNRKSTPNERSDGVGGSRESNFIEGRSRPRMAGEINIFTAEPDYLRPPIKGLWLKQPSLRTSTILRGSPIPDETDSF